MTPRYLLYKGESTDDKVSTIDYCVWQEDAFCYTLMPSLYGPPKMPTIWRMEDPTVRSWDTRVYSNNKQSQRYRGEVLRRLPSPPVVAVTAQPVTTPPPTLPPPPPFALAQAHISNVREVLNLVKHGFCGYGDCCINKGTRLCQYAHTAMELVAPFYQEIVRRYYERRLDVTIDASRLDESAHRMAQSCSHCKRPRLSLLGSSRFTLNIIVPRQRQACFLPYVTLRCNNCAHITTLAIYMEPQPAWRK